MLKIGNYTLRNNLVLAPMAGVTDQPFRNLCKKLGAGMAVSEMVTSDSRLWNSRKSKYRLDHSGESEPRIVQIAGSDPQMMAEAARINISNGAQIIDINMGCPAKKVCNKAAGSALLKDEQLVSDILNAVVKASTVPVTLKIRTGWCKNSKNATTIATIAENAGISALTVHGRTRACRFKGDVEYDTIAKIKQRSQIPVIANGDINSADKAQYVLDYTGADAIMVGRAAQGKPWIFADIEYFLQTGDYRRQPTIGEIKEIVTSHLSELHRFYGDFLGMRIARKHMGWYLAHFPGGKDFSKGFNQLESTLEQTKQLEVFFQHLDSNERIAA